MRLWITLLIALLAAELQAAGLETFTLTLRDHLFFPSRLEVPAGVKFKLVLDNKDNTAEEFDSFDLNREKVVFGHSQSTIYVGPLVPGNYEFFGEYNSNTARGTIVAVTAAEEPKDVD